MKPYKNLIFGIFFCLLIGLVFIGLKIHQQNELLANQTAQQKAILQQQLELKESIRKSGLVHLMSEILVKVEKELHDNPTRKLSDETIARLSDLSHSFEPQPYIYLETDSLLKKKPSPERGQLLLALSRMKIDSISFKKIKSTVSFAGADLSKTNLSEINLSGANLTCAIFREAILNHSNFEKADLRGTDFWAANLNQANLKNAKLNRANLSWAELNRANLSSTDLRDINLQSAKLRDANFSDSKIRTGNLQHTICSNAVFKKADLKDAKLNHANIENANFTNADLRRANLSEAFLKNVNFTDALLTEAGVFTNDWIQILPNWKVVGADSIQKKYKIADKVFGVANFELGKK